VCLPGWGRNEEVPSEDSFLAGKVGAAMTRGIQGRNSGGSAVSKYVLILGALKHVTAYSLEDWVDDTGGPRNGTKYNRMGFDATISRHDLAETYLEQFRIAITESEPVSHIFAALLFMYLGYMACVFSLFSSSSLTVLYALNLPHAAGDDVQLLCHQRISFRE
jgi:beta-glucosidase-like glycosyl hydrolase